MDEKQPCGIADHDLDNPIQEGRARWYCRKCGQDISLAYLFYCEAVFSDKQGSFPEKREAKCG